MQGIQTRTVTLQEHTPAGRLDTGAVALGMVHPPSHKPHSRLAGSVAQVGLPKVKWPGYCRAGKGGPLGAALCFQFPLPELSPALFPTALQTPENRGQRAELVSREGQWRSMRKEERRRGGWRPLQSDQCSPNSLGRLGL